MLVLNTHSNVRALNLTSVDQVVARFIVTYDSSRYSDLLGPPFPDGYRGRTHSMCIGAPTVSVSLSQPSQGENRLE